MYYADYLQLNKLLESQALASEACGEIKHDEMLFIITHQVYELWFKQVLFEVDDALTHLAVEYLREQQLATVVARFERVKEIMRLLVQQVDILKTMTPMDFLEFRQALSPASGFQSVQFRLLELKLGIPDVSDAALAPYINALSQEDGAVVKQCLASPSLFNQVESWLTRIPFLGDEGFAFWESYQAAVKHMLESDEEMIMANTLLSDEERIIRLKQLACTWGSFSALFDGEKYSELVEQGECRFSQTAIVSALFIYLYRDEPALQMPYRLLSLLGDIDDLLTSWRDAHALLVQRMIGAKVGTGGSSGYRYLRDAAEKRKIFRDLSHLSSFIIPRSSLPPLPPECQEEMRFVYRAR